MKQTLILTTLILAAVCCARGQGTFLVDQGINPTNAPGVFTNVRPDPTGESFIPVLSSIGFVQFYLTDPNFQGSGSTLAVNLWSGSLSGGTLVGTSDSVSLTWDFQGSATFLFSTPIAIVPGDTYYIQPIIQSGDSEEVGLVPGVLYPNGIAYLSGTPDSGSDLWFREGIVLPEPSSCSLAFIGLVGLYAALRKRRTHI